MLRWPWLMPAIFGAHGAPYVKRLQYVSSSLLKFAYGLSDFAV